MTTYSVSLDKIVVVELKSSFSGNVDDVLCAFGSIVLGSNATVTQYKLVSQQNGVEKLILKP